MSDEEASALTNLTMEYITKIDWSWEKLAQFAANSYKIDRSLETVRSNLDKIVFMQSFLKEHINNKITSSS